MVVYKIDRLTRSLMDFARLVEVFDVHGVSFVSVTQQFNTTTSMGRLTLNVLLSFAQFEREVTAERIRDKIAASKKKGMWMGVIVPLGYEARERRLVIEDEEARIVRHLFSRYLELKSVRALAEECAAKGLTGRARRRPDGSRGAGKQFGRDNLCHLLSNPIYIGRIRHRDRLHDGEHEAIIDEATFAAAKALLEKQAPRRRSKTNHPGTHLLTGILFDDTGDRLSPVHASRKGVRYRYYVSNRLSQARRKDGDGWRIPAGEVESLVEEQLIQILRDEAQIADWIQEVESASAMQMAVRRAGAEAAAFRSRPSSEKQTIIRRLFSRIVLKPDWVHFEIIKGALVDWLTGIDDAAQPKQDDRPGRPEPSTIRAIDLPVTLKRRGVEQRIVLQNGTMQSRPPDAALVELIARAHLYLDALSSGACTSLTEVAARYATDLSEVSRILPLAFLAPKIVEAVIAGEQPVELSAQRLSRLSDLPIAWHEQIEALGF